MLTSLLTLLIASSLEGPITSGNIIDQTTSGFSSIIEAQNVPIKDSYYISPVIEASATVAIDMNTDTILFEKNAHQRRSIASITKLMTLLIVLEENNLDEEITISENAAQTEGSSMYLHAGEKIVLENLIYGAIIQSANDAAVALAENNAGSIEAFVEKMNQKALSLGLVNTHFANPIGLDDPGNYSSAYDVAKLSKYVYQHQFIRHAAKLKELEVRSISGDYTHHLISTNDLLDSYLNVKGLKTGSTDSAGLCLSSVAENDNGNEIITVVLNSPARFKETKILIDWVFRAYNW